MKQLCRKTLEYPPFSPDLTPSDFHVFGPLNETLEGQRFNDYSEAEAYVSKVLQPRSTLIHEDGTSKLLIRGEKCVSRVGDYIEKWSAFIVINIIWKKSSGFILFTFVHDKEWGSLSFCWFRIFTQLHSRELTGSKDTPTWMTWPNTFILKTRSLVAIFRLSWLLNCWSVSYCQQRNGR